MSDDWVYACDYKARCFVQGTVKNARNGGMVEPASRHWSARFITHPMVRQATLEGWDRDLRAHIVSAVRRRIMARQPYDAVEDLMPTDRRWIDHVRKEAVAFQKAKEWRENRQHEREAKAPKDDSQDRKGWSKAGEAATRAAEAGFPDYKEVDA